MYRWSQLQRLVATSGGQVLAASASSWAALADEATVEALAVEPERWATFLDQEVDVCAEPGALDGGTHLLVAVTAE
jgi:hypothetical protein